MSADFYHTVMLAVKVKPKDLLRKDTLRSYNTCEHFTDEDEVRKVVEGGASLYCHECGDSLLRENVRYVPKGEHERLFTNAIYEIGYDKCPDAQRVETDELISSRFDCMAVGEDLLVGHEMHMKWVTNCDMFELAHDGDTIDELTEKFRQVGLRFIEARYYSIAGIMV